MTQPIDIVKQYAPLPYSIIKGAIQYDVPSQDAAEELKHALVELGATSPKIRHDGQLGKTVVVVDKFEEVDRLAQNGVPMPEATAQIIMDAVGVGR